MTGLIELVAGFSIITIVIIMQYISISSLSAEGGGKIILSENQYNALNNAALPTFATLLIGAGILLVGLNNFLHSWQKIVNNSGGLENYRAMPAIQRAKALIALTLLKEKRVFWFSLFGYSMIFLISSGMAVYSPENISAKYGVSIPSYYVTSCCGQPGNFPVLTIYLIEHFGLLIIPSNMLLLLFLPFLVAINISILVHSVRLTNLSKRNRANSIGKDISICGISVGIFAGCPTCAGSILFSLICSGGFSSVGLAGIVIAGYQPLIMIASIGTLLSAPIISVLKK